MADAAPVAGQGEAIMIVVAMVAETEVGQVVAVAAAAVTDGGTPGGMLVVCESSASMEAGENAVTLTTHAAQGERIGWQIRAAG